MEDTMSASSFKISMQWAPPFTPCDTEEEISLGDMLIEANEQTLTKNVSSITRSLRDSIRVSSYPLALWFTACWWRLLYEPIPSGEQIEKSYSWKNSHSLVSANSGYMWPHISFIPDGRFITIISSQQFSDSKLPLFYLGSKDALIVDNKIFITAIKDFIKLTIDRLDDYKKYNTNLHTLFMQLHNEMEDEDFALYRRVEALLGYDPDEAPAHVIEKIETALKIFNERIVTELLSACSINETVSPIADLESAISMSKTGVKGRWINPLPTKVKHNMLPWEMGRSLAKKLRMALGNTDKKIETKTLCNLLGITEKEISNSHPTHDRFSVSHVNDDKLYINLKRESSSYYSTGRRFQITRLIGSLLAHTDENIFILSDCKTYSQKVQRAFAAEFLAPLDAVRNFIQKNVTTETIGKAADHFSVSPQTIAHSLTNQGIISKNQLSELVF